MKYYYLPGTIQCPKCGCAAIAGTKLTAVGAMPAQPCMDFSVTCAGGATPCGTYTAQSPIGVSNASPSDVAMWGVLY